MHRFIDPNYAALSQRMRTGDNPTEVFDELNRRGLIAIHPTEVERTAALAEAGAAGDLVIAGTRDQVADLNATIRDHLHATLSATHDEPIITTARGERIGVGDRVATRRNAPTLQVANRQTWTVNGIRDDGSLLLHGHGRDREIPAEYATQFVELAYATTVHGAQGDTVDRAQVRIGEATGAKSAYVAMTRGRHANVAHLVAENIDDAKKQWVDVFSRDRADLGPAAAAQQAAEDIERYGPQPPTRPLEEVLGDLWTAWTREADLQERHQRLVNAHEALQHVAAIHARYMPDRDRLSGEEVNARRSWLDAREQVADLDAALKSGTADLQTRIRGAWHQELAQARRTAEVVRAGAGRLGQHRRQVREAGNELTAFAQRWHPALPDLPTGPGELAEEVMWLHGRRVEDPINAYIERTVADAHPDADRIRDAERHAYTAYNRAEQARTRLDEIIYAELRPYGQTARTRDATGRLNAVADELAGVERDLRAASARVQALASEPSFRTLPDEGLDGEHDRWTADHLARRQAATREANVRRQRQQETRRRIEPPPPSRSTPDHGWGVGR